MTKNILFQIAMILGVLIAIFSIMGSFEIPIYCALIPLLVFFVGWIMFVVLVLIIVVVMDTYNDKK